MKAIAENRPWRDVRTPCNERRQTDDESNRRAPTVIRFNPRIQGWSSLGGNRALVGAAALVVIATFSAHTWIGVRAWRSHPALFRQMVAADSANYRGRWLLGLDARSRGDTTAALAWLGQAYALYPRDRQLVSDYSETLMQHGQPREAAAVARRLMDWPELRRTPEAVALYLNSVERWYGPDSAIAAGRWLRASLSEPVAQKTRLVP